MSSLLDKMIEKKRQAALQSSASASPSDNNASNPQEPAVGAPPPRTATAADIMRKQMESASIDQSVRFIDLDLIDVEAQVREEFDMDYIMDLATDFALSPSKQPDQPITVFSRANGRYLLSRGENRLRAMKFARDNRDALGSQDPTDFTSIRATIAGPEPDTQIEKTQVQVKENVLRDGLKLPELGKALLTFFEENPNATQSDAAAWCGFRNQASGRVKVNNALKLMKCDSDLIERVRKKQLSAEKAFAIQEAREAEKNTHDIQSELSTSALTAVATTDTGGEAAPVPEKVKPQKGKRIAALENAPKKQVTVAIPLERVLQVGELVNWIAKQKGMEPISFGSSVGRKEAMTILNHPLFDSILESIKSPE